MMRATKVFALAALCAALAAPFGPGGASQAAEDPKPADAKPADAKTTDAKTTDAKATDAKPKFSGAQIKAFLAKCSDEADAKGLDVKKGKGAERKAYRRDCMHRLGVDPK